MAFNWSDAGLAAVSPGTYAAKKVLGKSKTTSQVPLLTPEQQAAMSQLSEFARTGKFGNFTAGAEVPLGYGDFNPTAIENQGLSSLQSLLNSGIPDQYRLGDQALQDLLQTNPAAIESQFSPFKAQLQRSIGESSAALKRGAGFAGNLYSTSAIKGLGDIQARGNEASASKLADLTNAAMDRRLQAIPLAYQSAQGKENIALGRIAASQQYGDLTRSLNDASIKARDAELLRRRQELMLPINAATTLAGSNAQFGVPSITTSPYQDLLALAGQIGGTYAGSYAGAAGARAGGQAGRGIGSTAGTYIG